MRTKLNAVLTDHTRLRELAALRLLDTPAEEPFDRLTRMAACSLGAPVALVSLVDERRQFFKSACGLPEPIATLRETPLSHSFCQHVVATATPLIISNARTHPLVCENLAVSELGVVAYLGVPLAVSHGIVIGSFCVVDTEPRHWTIDDRQIMLALAASVVSEIALRSANDHIAKLHRTIASQRRVVHAAQRLAHLSQLLTGEQVPTGHLLDDTRQSLDQMTDAVNNVLSHGEVEPENFDTPTLNTLRKQLTGRQLEVFDLLMRGLQTKEIARHLGVSPRTIEAHRSKILERLQISTFSALLKQLLARPTSH